MTAMVGRLGRAWEAAFAAIEGPEQEARVLHSHYLAYRAARSHEAQLAGWMNGDILDVGAGAGYGKRLLNHGARYFPTDLPTGRDMNDARVTRQGVPLVKECSVYAIDYEDNRFDGCLALSLFEHLKEPDRAFAEIKRVVKPDGMILVVVPFAFPVHGHPDDYWRWTEEGLKLYFSRHGVEVVECVRSGGTVDSLVLGWNLFLGRGLFGLPEGWSVARGAARAVARPFMTLSFLAGNLFALAVGRVDDGASPISVACLGRNKK